jgi:hypothetical protein
VETLLPTNTLQIFMADLVFEGNSISQGKKRVRRQRLRRGMSSDEVLKALGFFSGQCNLDTRVWDRACAFTSYSQFIFSPSLCQTRKTLVIACT